MEMKIIKNTTSYIYFVFFLCICLKEENIYKGKYDVRRNGNGNE